MPFWKRHDFRPGDRFDEGRVVWCADPTSGAPRAAFYPIQDNGSLNFDIPLVWVEASDDPNNNDGYFRVVSREDCLRFEDLPDPTVLLT
jgi:hypothetical protein